MRLQNLWPSNLNSARMGSSNQSGGLPLPLYLSASSLHLKTCLTSIRLTLHLRPSKLRPSLFLNQSHQSKQSLAGVWFRRDPNGSLQGQCPRSRVHRRPFRKRCLNRRSRFRKHLLGLSGDVCVCSTGWMYGSVLGFCSESSSSADAGTVDVYGQFSASTGWAFWLV